MAEDITVGDVMVKGAVTMKAEESVLDAAKLMKRHGIGSVVVVKGSVPEGIICAEDIVCDAVAESKDLKATKVKDVMATPVASIDVNAPLEEAWEKMRDLKVKRLPVVSGKRLVGIISAGDLVKVQPALMELAKSKCPCCSDDSE